MSLVACAAGPPQSLDAAALAGHSSAAAEAPADPGAIAAPGSAPGTGAADAGAAPSRAIQEATLAQPSPVESVRVLDFSRELSEPVTSIAIGQPRVGVLASEPWVKERGQWQKLPIPAALRPTDAPWQAVRIFFGRDDRPRLMGARAAGSASGAEAVYLRHRTEGWIAERAEIGRLSGDPPGGLFGVLGHQDPEVVCKVADICIIKRRTGWKTMPAGPGMPRVELCGAQAWALHADHVARLGDGDWQRVGGEPPWTAPSGLWAIGHDDLWVAVAADDALFHFDGRAWARHPSPVAGPRGLWASGQDDLWLVGDGGAAHFDGARWRRVEGPEGPLSEVNGTSRDDIWLGGESGLWHGVPPRAGQG